MRITLTMPEPAVSNTAMSDYVVTVPEGCEKGDKFTANLGGA
jgi:hypothetical protein